MLFKAKGRSGHCLDVTVLTAITGHFFMGDSITTGRGLSGAAEIT